MYVISDDDDDDDDDGSGAESQYKVTSHLAPSRTFAQLNKEISQLSRKIFLFMTTSPVASLYNLLKKISQLRRNIVLF